jgi:uncharacterized delta-60 repeat protein
MSVVAILVTTLAATTGAYAGLDPSFSDDGVVQDETIWATAALPDGRIVYATKERGPGRRGITLHLLNQHGDPDSRFSDDGAFTVRWSESIYEGHLTSVLMSADADAITVFTTSDSGLWALARVRVDGTLDPAFGVGGRRMMHGPATWPGPGSALRLRPDGGFDLLHNEPAEYYSIRTSWFRFTPTGRRDHSFAEDGRLMLYSSANGTRSSFNAFAPPGGMFMARVVGPGVLRLIRLNRRGEVDRNFSDDGRLEFRCGPPYEGAAYHADLSIHVDTRGRTIVWCREGTHDVMTRWTSAGTLDPTFGGDGRLRLDTPGNRMTIDDMDRLVLWRGTDDDQVYVARINEFGWWDTCFGYRGRELVDVPADSGAYYAEAVTTRTRIVLGMGWSADAGAIVALDAPTGICAA